MADLSKLPKVPAKCLPAGVTDQHGKDVFDLRFGTATNDAAPTGTVTHTTNGDEDKYSDKSGTYSKALAQTSYGVVDPTAFTLFRTALGSPDGTIPGTADFEVPHLLGGKRKLNGPLGAFAFTLVGADSRHSATPSSLRRPSWPAPNTPPNSSSCTGPRCSAMCRSRITRQTRSPPRRPTS